MSAVYTVDDEGFEQDGAVVGFASVFIDHAGAIGESAKTVALSTGRCRVGRSPGAPQRVMVVRRGRGDALGETPPGYIARRDSTRTGPVRLGSVRNSGESQ